MGAEIEIGAKVKVTVDCWDDLRDDGMGMSLCAGRGEVLVVRGHSTFMEGRLFVSHEHITDRSFTVDPGEYELLPAAHAGERSEGGGHA